MSGHSKWKKIKRQKGIADIKKGNIFTKLAQSITIAVREGGGGVPNMNFLLRLAVDKAKSENMPKDNIERAIKKGLGLSEKGGQLESVTYEVIGSEGIALLVDCLTDNKNRTISDIRNVITKRGFHIGGGSLMWQFETLGKIVISPSKIIETIEKGRKLDKLEKIENEDLILEIMDWIGVKDVEDLEDEINIITTKEDFKAIYNKVSDSKYKIEKAEIIKLPKSKVEIKGSLPKVKETITELEDLDDVVAIWTNVNL